MVESGCAGFLVLHSSAFSAVEAFNDPKALGTEAEFLITIDLVNSITVSP